MEENKELLIIQDELLAKHPIYIKDTNEKEQTIINIVSFLNNEFVEVLSNASPEEYIFDDNCFVIDEDEDGNPCVAVVEGSDIFIDLENIVGALDWLTTDFKDSTLCKKEDYNILKKIKLYYDNLFNLEKEKDRN